MPSVNASVLAITDKIGFYKKSIDAAASSLGGGTSYWDLVDNVDALTDTNAKAFESIVKGATLTTLDSSITAIDLSTKFTALLGLLNNYARTTLGKRNFDAYLTDTGLRVHEFFADAFTQIQGSALTPANISADNATHLLMDLVAGNPSTVTSSSAVLLPLLGSFPITVLPVDPVAVAAFTFTVKGYVSQADVVGYVTPTVSVPIGAAPVTLGESTQAGAMAADATITVGANEGLNFRAGQSIIIKGNVQAGGLDGGETDFHERATIFSIAADVLTLTASKVHAFDAGAKVQPCFAKIDTFAGISTAATSASVTLRPLEQRALAV